MQSEASLITEDVECFAMGVLGSRGIVLTLVEKGAGLLAFEAVEMELHAVHGEGGCGLVSVHEAGGAGWKGFQFADAWIDSFDYRRRVELID